MITTIFSNLTEKDKNTAIEGLIAESTPHHDFFLMVVLSVLMATFGLLINNTAVVIGSMLITPLLSPILGISLGIVMADTKLIYRSFFTVIKSIGFAIPASAIVAIIAATTSKTTMGINTEILGRAQPTIIFAAIALVAGLAASFALIKPHLNAALPGVAISVALIPPIAVTGIGIATLDLSLAVNSFVLFVINAAAIVFASMIVFSLMNLYIKQTVANRAINIEDKKLEEEVKEAKKSSGN